MTEFGQLYAIAQIAIAISGFAALVVAFKQRRDGMWSAADADRFHGMLAHGLAAAFFCILPPVVAVFTENSVRLWSICSALLGIQILAQSTLIALLPSSNMYTRLGLIPPLLAAALLGANVFGGDGLAEFGPYLVGILWHTFQSGVLFFLLIRVPATRMLSHTVGKKDDNVT